MQPKRHRDYINRSPVANQLRYHRRSPDPYLKYGRNPREEGSTHLGRGLSPHNIERSRRILVDDRRSSSLERREYSWNLVAGRNEQLQSRSPHAGRLGSSRINHVRSRSPQRGHLDSNRIEHARSRSPPLGQVRVRPHLDDGLLLSKNSPTLKFRHDFQLKSIEYNDDITPNVKHNYGYGDCSSPRIRKEKDFCGSKSLYTDGQGVFVQEANLSEDDRSQGFNRMPPELGPSSNYVDRGRNKDDDSRYQNPLPSNKFSFTEPRKEIFTDNSYPGITHPKDFQSKYPYKNESSLMGLSGDDFRSSYHEKLPLFSEKYGNGSEKLRESLGFNSYSQTRLIDSSKDLDAVHKAYQRNHPRSPDQFDLNDYHYPAHPKRDSDDYGYSSGDLYGKMPGRAIDYNYRDSLRARKEEPVIDSFDDIETSTSRNLWDYPYLRNQRASNYLDVTETSKFSHRSGEYFDSKDTLADFGRRDPHLGSDSGLQRGPDFEHYKEQSRGSPSFKYREDVHGLALSQPPLRINPRESGMYGFDSSNTILNRKFEVEEESRHDLRRSMLSKWNTSGGNGDLDYDEECLDERVNVENQSERAERRLEDRLGHGGATAFHKPDRRIMKNNNKGPVLSHRLGKRVNFYHHEKVWKRSKADYYEAEHEVEADEEWVKYSRNEPPEESEEFKQLVQKAFLIFSKKLNENLSLRRKYQEQGKVGTLFCIVCGRSVSKEFMDTQGLVKHAIMSHRKRGLHLGLHKAICVLLGWDTALPQDAGRSWVPRSMPSTIAATQKEDLILWPPVILIHNASIPNNKRDEQKVITVEALGSILRGKGFTGGKMKVCLGRPSDNSLFVVKFLGTFSGLQEAENLHKYFIENKCGRAELKQITFKSGKSRKTDGETVEEVLLYGYMAIAGDLDKVDIDTKKRCLVKSKKEIQDLADAPVKP